MVGEGYLTFAMRWITGVLSNFLVAMWSTKLEMAPLDGISTPIMSGRGAIARLN